MESEANGGDRQRVFLWNLPARPELDMPNAARMYDYYLARHEALRIRAEVRDLRRWAVAAV